MVVAVSAAVFVSRAHRAPSAASHAGGAANAVGGVVAAPAPVRLGVRVLRSFEHDPEAYTQGLLWHDGSLIESAGRYGQSTLRRWQPADPTSVEQRSLAPHLFAEGLARVADRLIQLTWREHVAIVWDLETLLERQRFDYRGEGWGLAWDGNRLVMSDGSARLLLRDPQTFAVTGRIDVHTRGRPLEGLNELEIAEGWIYANVYETEQIVRIDPTDGHVAAIIDAGSLRQPWPRAEVLNGIAYNPDTETFYLTGKLWPQVFEVVFE